MTYFVFCHDTTRMYTSLSDALRTAYEESEVINYQPIDVYTHAADNSISRVVASVKAVRP